LGDFFVYYVLLHVKLETLDKLVVIHKVYYIFFVTSSEFAPFPSAAAAATDGRQRAAAGDDGGVDIVHREPERHEHEHTEGHGRRWRRTAGAVSAPEESEFAGRTRSSGKILTILKSSSNILIMSFFAKTSSCFVIATLKLYITQVENFRNTDHNRMCMFRWACVIQSVAP
jgi:hypothetical protein